MKRIIFISGSRRKNSFNRALAESAAAIIGTRACVSFLDYSAIPFFSQDDEYPAPEEVRRIRAEIMEADGIWIFSPEYNSYIPGGLKNLLDWLSRSLVKDDPDRVTAMTGMKVTFSGAAGHSGGMEARKQLEKLASMMRMNHMEGEETGIRLSAASFASGTLYMDDEDRRRLKDQAERFLSFIGA